MVAADFARIRAAGFDSVRLFLLWEDFQPDAMEVSRAVLRRLVSVADLAGETGLELMPTLFTGHMSGVNWIPAWALGGTQGDERFRVVSGGVSTKEPRNALPSTYSGGSIPASDSMVDLKSTKLTS